MSTNTHTSLKKVCLRRAGSLSFDAVASISMGFQTPTPDTLDNCDRIKGDALMIGVARVHECGGSERSNARNASKHVSCAQTGRRS